MVTVEIAFELKLQRDREKAVTIQQFSA